MNWLTNKMSLGLLIAVAVLFSFHFVLPRALESNLNATLKEIEEKEGRPISEVLEERLSEREEQAQAAKEPEPPSPTESIEKRIMAPPPVYEKPKKTEQPPLSAPGTSKNTELEIEKCKAKLSEGVPLEDIVATVNAVFQPLWEDFRARGMENVNRFLQCLKMTEQSDGGEFCRTAAQKDIKETEEAKKDLEKQQQEALEQLIKQQQQKNYQDCLNSI